MNKLVFTLSMGIASIIGVDSVSAYTVKSGDTLGEIATNHDVSLQSVVAANPSISNPNVIFPMDDIRIPEAGTKAAAAKPKEAVVHKEAVVQSNHSISNNERDLIARLVKAEANNQSFEGKQAVAEVILNRVKSDQFPDSVHGVVFQSNQFVPAQNGMINRSASSEDYAAVDAALRSGSDGSLYFYNPSISGASWLDSRPTVKVIGDHVFKR